MYKLVIRFMFEVCGELFYASPPDENNHIAIEEVRKNGQEDSHLSGVVYFDSNGQCFWAEKTASFDHEFGLDEDILQFFRANGLPPRMDV